MLRHVCKKSSSLSAALKVGSRNYAAAPTPSLAAWFSRQQTAKYLQQKQVSYIGAPLAAGQHMAGVELGPQAVRDGGVQRVAEALGWKFRDVGDLDLEGAQAKFTGETQVKNVGNCEKIGLANKLLHDTVKAEAEAGNFVLTVGGDHSVGSATVTGMRAVHKELAVVWVDAHADCNIPTTSPSGNYHGMSCAHSMGWIKPPLPYFEWIDESCIMNEARVALLALRDVDEHERKLLRNSGVAVFTMHEIDRWGIGQVLEMALHRINPHSDRPIHLSFDIDACDPSIAPGTGTCSRGGLNFREAHYICERLSMTNSLTSMDVVEINPSIDLPIPGRMHGDSMEIKADLQTVRLGVELISSALGRTII